MSFQVNVPPSVVSKMAKTDEGGGGGEETVPSGGKKREDWRKLKELEEARKAGTAPAMQDEEGRDINPHIPQYIMQAPWYFGAEQATLNHQRIKPDMIKTYNAVDDWYKRGVKEGSLATRYRKGACENCGALTHKRKDCLERPRKVGARFTGTDIAPDEFEQPTLSFDWDAKRDRWNGYDLVDHKKVVDEFRKIEEAKKELKGQRLEKPEDEEETISKMKSDVPLAEGDEDQEDEDKYVDDMAMPGQKMDSKQRITVRNLRIREDTAKYLYNLNPESAYYDPKTRSMRENPFESTGKESKDLPYAGDNFVRFSGDSHMMSKRQVFAWEAYEKGVDVHLQADPTKLEVLNREFKKRKENYKTDVRSGILEKYGGEEHLDAPPKELLLAQTEDYVEYSRTGSIVKGQEHTKVKSRYEEDVFISNHTSVWGSYWQEGQWGFQCCHSLVKESYCTGEAGRAAVESTITEMDEPEKIIQQQMQLALLQERDESETMIKPKSKTEKKKEKKKRKKKKKKKKESSSESSSSSENEEEEREQRVRKAMAEEEKRVKQVDKYLAMDERKRPYNSMFNVTEPTEAEVEAFRRKRVCTDDPMARFMAAKPHS